MNIGAVVLCGGKSSRMGSPKAFLAMDGETFLHRTLEQLQDFDEILLSINGSERNLPPQYQAVVDQYPACGPMGGLHAALSVCQSEALLAVACDMPYFSSELARLLREHLTPAVDAVIPVTPDGRYHPLCGIYRKTLGPVFQKYLQNGDYKLRSALGQIRVCYIPVTPSLAFCLRNVNTPEEYQALL